jgi:putative ABC transport system permease protein
MLRSYLVAAWRSARRDRFYALLNVLGLGLGFAAAILIGLFARDELSYDRFLPDYQDVYRAQLNFSEPSGRTESMQVVPERLAAEMRLDFPEIAATARMVSQTAALRHGEVEAIEPIHSADADFFQVLGFKLLAGDPATALAEPDSIVLTRRLAEKYFGTIDCVGQTLDLNSTHPVRVTAIAEDPPSDTTVPFTALLSGKSPYSSLAKQDMQPREPKGELRNSTVTFIRLKPGTRPQTLASRLPGFVFAHYPDATGEKPLFTLHLRPIAELHLHPANPGMPDVSSATDTLYAVSATGLLILLLAGVNFVNLVTARATRRALEVGIRKAMGGMRRQLMMQFMGESVAYALAGLVLGMALAELCVPTLNAFLDRQIAFDYWRHPLLALAPVVTAVLLGLVAGLHPAAVLSSFAPATVLKARSGGSVGGGRLRLALVVFQFTVTIGLVVATTVIYRQNLYATSQALHFDKNLVLAVDITALPWHETPDGMGQRETAPVEALRNQLAALPGVEAVAASFIVPQSDGSSVSGVFKGPDQGSRPPVMLQQISVDYGFFNVYGLRLVAGRDFARDRAEDLTSSGDHTQTASAIINQAALRDLGFATAEAALGQEVVSDDPAFPGVHNRIIGVVPDFPIDSIREPVPPTMFTVDPALFKVFSLKLSGRDLPETLRAIDRTWRDFVADRPIHRSFVDARIDEIYRDVTSEGRLFAGFAGFAAAIGCLGLVGLSAYTAERRTKEIGIRKALGASTFEVTRLLIWQFVKPVLLANLIAWPLAWWFMRRWLDGFAYRIELDAAPFLIAGLGALVIAIGTTAFHAVQVARSRPVLALRYE